jgi:hypothetical protein
MTSESEYSEIIKLVESGQVLIGIHTSGAVHFLDKSKNEMEQLIGEPADFARLPVRWSLYLGSLSFYASFFFAIKAFGWWALLAIPLSFAVFALRYAFSQLGRQRIASTVLFTIVSLIIVATVDSSIWLKLWIAFNIFTIVSFKLMFYFAQHLLRSLVARNYKAFSILEGTLVSVRR